MFSLSHALNCQNQPVIVPVFVEKLLCLNTASAVSSGEREMGQGDHLRDTDVLEEGEVEEDLKVTNPPPSPASPPPPSDDEALIPGRTLIR